MIYRVFGFLTDVLCFQTDRVFAVILYLLALMFFLDYSHIIVLKRGRALFWIGVVAIIFGVGLTGGVYVWRSPRGLSGTYYDNPSWSGEPANSLRYFETPGRRVDRFIDFNPNDFNDRYPFSGKPFSVKWQGSVYIPDERYQLGTVSNFGTWLYVDNILVEGPHKIDFGTAEARTYLREGWSHDEQWGQDTNLSFIWSSGQQTEFYLGVDELTDYQLIVRCMPFTYEGSPKQELTISINEIPLETKTLKDGWNTYALQVSREVIQERAPGFFRVRFAYSNVVRPSEILKNSQDGRQLAVAFDFAEMQKASVYGKGESVLPQEFPETAFLSQGFHDITLKTQSKGIDPFIRLVWKREDNSNIRIIPEDYLFPEVSVPTCIHKVFSLERIILRGTILYKFSLIVFFLIIWGTTLFRNYIRSAYLLELFTTDFLLSLGLGLVAFSLQLFFLLETTRIDPTFYHLPPGTDQLNYVFFARGFLRGYWPWFTHAPLYFNSLVSIFLICTSIVFGESIFISKLLVIIMGGISVSLLYRIARKHFNISIAVIAALLCVLNGVYIFYSASLLVALQVTFLSIVLLWYTHRVPKRFSIKSAIVFGIMFGLLALGRATFLLFAPFLFLWIVFTWKQKLLPKLAYCFIICCMILLVISPVTVFNYYSDGRHQFILITTSGGWNLWVGNNSSATGGYSYNRELLQKTREHMRATGSTYIDEVLLFIKEQPMAYLELQWRKFTMVWRGFEIANLKPYYLFRENSSLLRLPLVNFVLIGPLSIVGLLLTYKKWRSLYLLHAFVVLQIAMQVIFLPLARYRIPVVPILSIFAAYTLWFVYQGFRKRQFMYGGLILLVCITLYVWLNYSEAAKLYEEYYHTSMPLVKMVRYWDLFREYGP